MEIELNMALAEIMRMREAAERIVWLAKTDKYYGKGRGQAAQEILDAATALRPRIDDEVGAMVLTGLYARVMGDEDHAGTFGEAPR